MNSLNKKIEFSLIIPVYNNEENLKDLVVSISNQSYHEAYEVIFIDDNSTDNSREVLENLIDEYLKNKKNIVVSLLHDGENKKQGYRRNQGINASKGEWVLFIDSDDYIHSETLKVCSERIKNEPSADMVFFNYGYVNSKENYSVVRSVNFNSVYKRENPSQLIGQDCEELLNLDPYFTVNKAYRKRFLKDNNIYFGEGYFYEDVIFYVKAALFAEQIEILPNMFYFVRVHDKSTTKTNYDDTHTNDIYKAIEESCVELKEARSYYSQYNAVKYFVNRALLYSEIRSNYTEKEKETYIFKVINMIQSYINPDEMNYPKTYYSNLYYAIFKMHFYQRNDPKNILAIYKLYRYKPSVLRKIVHEHKKNKHSYKTKMYRKLTLTKNRNLVNSEGTTEMIEEDGVQSVDNIILMLGFDYRYAGNSKYLFEQLIKKYNSKMLKFVCKDDLSENLSIDTDYFIEPNSDEFYEYLYKSKVVIAESWIPLRFKFSSDQTLIQLWHGQPLKKMLFDSYELSVLEWNPRTKEQKSIDISRWDKLLSESVYSDSKFKTAMAIEDDKLISGIYPRNQWLLDNAQNELLKSQLRLKCQIPENKKVVLYLPTWRDYNFKQKNYLKDDNYLLNFDRLGIDLENPDDYFFIVKGHGMENNLGIRSENICILDSDEDVQPYYLITDIFITDYSSSLFDAMLLDIPSYLIFKDFDYYNKIRGIYDECLLDFKNVTAYSEKELAELLNKAESIIYNKEKYIPSGRTSIIPFIESKLDNNFE